jgi:metal-dependent amidase/aminoacylase/carboxypeptidase family protein
MNSVLYRVILKGAGGHGSRPDLAKNPITCFANIEQFINSCTAFGRFEIISVSSGTSGNIIPKELEMIIKLSFENSGEEEKAVSDFVDKIGKLASVYGCEVLLEKMKNSLKALDKM